jgi:hypothetical protein
MIGASTAIITIAEIMTNPIIPIGWYMNSLQNVSIFGRIFQRYSIILGARMKIGKTISKGRAARKDIPPGRYAVNVRLRKLGTRVKPMLLAVKVLSIII